MIDIWLNQCLLCGTNNPSKAKQRPADCTGCGQKLTVLDCSHLLMGTGAQDLTYKNPTPTTALPTVDWRPLHQALPVSKAPSKKKKPTKRSSIKAKKPKRKPSIKRKKNKRKSK